MTTSTASRSSNAEGGGQAETTRGTDRGRARADDDAGANTGKKAKSKKKIVGVVLVVATLAGGYYAFLGPKPSASAEPEPGIVVDLGPVTLNLDGGRYLKMGMALQFTADLSGGGHGGTAEEPDGSKALDLAIAQLSNRKAADLISANGRSAAKAALLEAVAEAYHGDVMDIYFTQFVMQ